MTGAMGAGSDISTLMDDLTNVDNLLDDTVANLSWETLGEEILGDPPKTGGDDINRREGGIACTEEMLFLIFSLSLCLGAITSQPVFPMSSS